MSATGAAAQEEQRVAGSGTDDWIVPDWDVPAAIRAVASTRRGPGRSVPPYDAFNLGLNSGDVPDIVRANRAALIRALDLPSEPRWLEQVHGARVVEWSRNDAPAAAPAADASITREPGIVLAVLSADCLPILVAAADGSEVAAIHAGWRGLAAGVIESALLRMCTPMERLCAWLGPAIGSDAYVVGEEVHAALGDGHAQAGSAFRAVSSGQWRCDLGALATQRLQRCGISRIRNADACTHDDAARFYSYRRDRRTGRMASLIWIAGPQA